MVRSVYRASQLLSKLGLSVLAHKSWVDGITCAGMLCPVALGSQVASAMLTSVTKAARVARTGLEETFTRQTLTLFVGAPRR